MLPSKKSVMRVMSGVILSELATDRLSDYINEDTESNVLLLYRKSVSDIILSGDLNVHSNKKIFETINKNVPDNASLHTLMFLGTIVHGIRTTLATEILKSAFKQNDKHQFSGSIFSDDDDECINMDSLFYQYKNGNKPYEA